MSSRRLVVLRHGKAGDPPGEPDARRPLTKRGRRDSRAAGSWVADRVGAVDLVVVSPALRARETAGDAVPELPQAPDERVDDRVYENTLPALLEVVRELPDEARTVLLVGHNPGLSELVSTLSGVDTDLSTAQVAVVAWDGGWPDAEGGVTAGVDLS